MIPDLISVIVPIYNVEAIYDNVLIVYFIKLIKILKF